MLYKEKGILCYFGSLERMNNERVTKEIYFANMEECTAPDRLRRAFSDQIGDFLKKGGIRMKNKGKCMKRLMKAKAGEVCLNWIICINRINH